MILELLINVIGFIPLKMFEYAPSLDFQLDLVPLKNFIFTEIFDRVAYFLPLSDLLFYLSIYILIINWKTIKNILTFILKFVPGIN